MKRLSKDFQDLQSQRSSTTYIISPQQQYAKSFTIPNTLITPKKFINISIPNLQPNPKQLYKKQPFCTICSKHFTTTFRQHHCRYCVNAVCGDCSRSIINKQRSCDVCILRYTNIHEEKKKKQILETLETLCAYLIYQKDQKVKELQKLKNNNEEDGKNKLQHIKEQLDLQNNLIQELENQNKGLKQTYNQLEDKLNQVRENNSEIQNKISEIQQEMEGSGIKY